jgi:hypothetical protein
VSVDIDGDRIIVGGYGESSNATGVNGDQENNQAGYSGAAYIFRRTGELWQQEAYLKASNTDPTDAFGLSVSISGERALIGAVQEDSNATDVGGIDSDNSLENSGAAYVFSRKSGDWAQEAYLKASNTDPGDVFGTSVSIEGDSIVIGARGESSNASGVNGDQTNNLVGGAGAAYLFEYQNQEWETVAYLKALNPAENDQFGRSVSISDQGIVVGATFGGSGGAAFVYGRRAGETGDPTTLLADNGGYMDYFGDSVAIEETSVIVGAYLEDSSSKGINMPDNNFSTSSGAAYEFSDLKFSDLIFKDSFE